MEQFGFIHCDIADRNILLDVDGPCLDGAEAKLADFGEAIFLGDARTYTVNDRELPTVLVPPEVFQTGKYVQRSDIWWVDFRLTYVNLGV